MFGWVQRMMVRVGLGQEKMDLRPSSVELVYLRCTGVKFTGTFTCIVKEKKSVIRRITDRDRECRACFGALKDDVIVASSLL